MREHTKNRGAVIVLLLVLKSHNKDKTLVLKQWNTKKGTHTPSPSEQLVYFLRGVR